MPTIMLGMPSHNDIYACIHDNLRYHGFDVTLLLDDTPFFYPNLWIRLYTKFCQKILGNSEAKNRLKAKLAISNLLPKITPHDYALFIRGDTYDSQILRAARKNSKHGSINYQWDGINRYPDIWEKLNDFDRFFVFASEDYQNNTHNFLPATNFYFDHIVPTQTQNSTFYYIGADLPSRQKAILTFADYAQKRNWDLDFIIPVGHGKQAKKIRQQYPYNNLQICQTGLSYQENLNRAIQCHILVDFLDSIHNGLSFRIFEALGYHKKLITTNITVKQYDFYHPNNIFIWDGVNLAGVDEWLELPYHTIDPTIRNKYSFGNWIRYILDIPPYQAINLPPYGIK